jgi:hypothetical protein
MRILISVLIALAPMANADDGFQKWKAQLPKEARAFHDADDIYWRDWFQRGFTPDVAWKNTDPKAPHTMARPLLKSER